MSDTQQCEADKTPGRISWTELMTNDAAASSNFYGSLFGWKTDEMQMEGCSYRMFKNGEKATAGMIEVATAECPRQWLSYVTVEDLELAVAKAAKLGAKIVKDVTNLPMGRFAVITDPQGATLGLWQFLA